MSAIKTNNSDLNELPTCCLAVLESSSDGQTFEIIAIRVGEKGYYRTSYDRQTREWVRDMNDRMGVDEAMQNAYEACSLFGTWHNLPTIMKHWRDALARRDAAQVPV